MPPVPHDKIKYIKPVPVLPCNNLDATIQFWVQCVPTTLAPHPTIAVRAGGGPMRLTKHYFCLFTLRLGWKLSGKHPG